VNSANILQIFNFKYKIMCELRNVVAVI